MCIFLEMWIVRKKVSCKISWLILLQTLDVDLKCWIMILTLETKFEEHIYKRVHVSPRITHFHKLIFQGMIGALMSSGLMSLTGWSTLLLIA
ncbi:unnamed protein product [Prunus brigantina]